MTEAEPLISVCIANYNGMDVIDDCLRSVLDQTGGLAVEILVHDDASSDDSAAYVRDRYPQVRLTVSDMNVGFCIANNRMAAQAKGRYLLLLNNDAALFPDALETLLTEANHINQPAILSLPQFDAGTGELVDRGCLLDPFFNPVPNLDPNRDNVAMVIGACLWVPNALWKELGGFPEWFGSIAEDMYLCCRARLAGYAVRALNVSGYRHWQGMSFGGGKKMEGRLLTTFRRRALTERNKTFVMVMTCPSPWIFFLFPIHLVLLLLEGSVLSVLKFDVRYLREIYLPIFTALVLRRPELLKGRVIAILRYRFSRKQFFKAFERWPYKLRMLARHGLPTVR